MKEAATKIGYVRSCNYDDMISLPSTCDLLCIPQLFILNFMHIMHHQSCHARLVIKQLISNLLTTQYDLGLHVIVIKMIAIELLNILQNLLTTS